jgi:cytochrome d ubiquinol oxidase subunit II
VLIAILAVSIWTPLMHAGIAQRWFSWPNILFLSPVPVITGVIAATECLGPMIVPFHYTLWQTASSPSTQGSADRHAFLLPIILMYTAWSCGCWGKVRGGGVGYH